MSKQDGEAKRVFFSDRKPTTRLVTAWPPTQISMRGRCLDHRLAVACPLQSKINFGRERSMDAPVKLDEGPYAAPRHPRLDDCDFYHVMDLPGVGRVGGEWDLRGRVDEYLGSIDFRGKRVLEIGPASGFLTVEMEKRGADVVAVEVTDDPGWDFVPYPAAILDPVRPSRREHMRRIKNSFWFTRAAHDSRARLYYGDATSLPDALGHFDVAVMAAVLLHVRSPAAIIESCARRSVTVVITDTLQRDLEGQPVCRLHPTAQNRAFDTWWDLSTTFLQQFLDVCGYGDQTVTQHTQHHRTGPFEFFTIVARAHGGRCSSGAALDESAPGLST
jgi:SAM-dependent methyltransferase